MKRHLITWGITAVLAVTTASTAWADKPSWAGGGKGRQESAGDTHHGGASGFNADARRIILDYYGGGSRGGNCPPGLAKKNNGCQPPGQAKKWSKGRPLPGDLRYNNLPVELLRRLPPPPANHRYVEIAGDILLIAAGTSVVVDAIEDLLR